MSILLNTKTIITKNDGARKLPFDADRLHHYLTSILEEFPNLHGQDYIDKLIRTIEKKDTYSAEQITNLTILRALEEMSAEQPDWTYVAARIYLRSLYRAAAKNRAYDASKKYGSFYGLLKTLGSKKIYSPAILRDYSKEEILELGECILPEKDYLYTYIGLKTLADRYLATDHARETYELPQERLMVIAMTLMLNEPKEKRAMLAKEAYWALSNHYMTVATPTFSNAGKSYGQLSSCFIDTIDDSLRGIYDSNTDVATLSKNGGGIN